ncbi:hypothetical protein PVA19_11305 [Agrobacterium sp. CNPSo 3708]|uniref:hypothetical protein n=1 Tax=Agrobacterium sp. CNPSo 3708 TaxID=3028150 RepID=UPI00236351C1|nr:hypothetical protein [Agrobacterium sp. CNPSo 3708]MDD1498999.1 hypothetical protein [Agrobacterium sp. CNPSo 3708]
MADPHNNPPDPSPNDTRIEKAHWLERAVSLGVAVWIVALVSFLILSQREYDDTSVYFLKILLSFSMAVLVATSAGFINLAFNVPGMAIRAGGAIAVFIFVFTQSPAVPALKLNPKIEMNNITGMDFRSLEAPDNPKFGTSPVAVTVPLGFKNVADKSRNGTWKRSTVKIQMYGKDVTFDSFYFVKLLPGVGGTWLSSGQLSEAKATDLIEGQSFTQEIMHLSQSGPTWGSFLSYLAEQKDPITVSVSAEVDGGWQSRACKFDPTKYAPALAKTVAEYKRLAGYVSVICEV